MPDESALSISPTTEELKALDKLLGGSRAFERKGASPFLRALCRSFLLAPNLSEERVDLEDMVERVAAEERVEIATVLLALSAELVAEGVL